MTRCEWRPLTAARSFVDRDGCFFAMTGPREGFFLCRC